MEGWKKKKTEMTTEWRKRHAAYFPSH